MAEENEKDPFGGIYGPLSSNPPDHNIWEAGTYFLPADGMAVEECSWANISILTESINWIRQAAEQLRAWAWAGPGSGARPTTRKVRNWYVCYFDWDWCFLRIKELSAGGLRCYRPILEDSCEENIVVRILKKQLQTTQGTNQSCCTAALSLYYLFLTFYSVDPWSIESDI